MIEDPTHQPCLVTLLDTVTGETVDVDDQTPWGWTEGNWSCDCNRQDYFGVDSQQHRTCIGCHRFLVTYIDPATGYSLAECNQGYPDELLALHGLPVLGPVTIPQIITPAQVDKFRQEWLAQYQGLPKSETKVLE